MYFASAREALSIPSETVLLPSQAFALVKLGQLIRDLHKDRIAELDEVLRRSAWSVNEEMIARDDEASVILHNGDVVAVIPPVSGG